MQTMPTLNNTVIDMKSCIQEPPVRQAHDGLELPAIGFGTYQVKGFDGAEAIASALDTGYRLLDTAVNYENEGTIGKAIRMSDVPREDILVTSKLPGRFHQYDKVHLAVEESLCRMGLDYVDLYLIHWPNPSQGLYVEAWQGLIDACNDGLIRHIGVSNFLPGHIEMLSQATGVIPAVNQVELHPFFQQNEIRQYDEEHGIITEAWSPLGRANQMLRNKVILEIANKHGASAVQTILRWHVQIGDVSIPKSLNPERQRENFFLWDFELDKEDMKRMSLLDNPEGRSRAQDSRWHEEM